MKKIILILFIIGIAAAFYFWFFQYNKEHIDVKAANADITLSVSEMLKDAEINITTPLEFDKKYLKKDGKGKIIKIKGIVNKIEPKDSVSNVIFGSEPEGFIISIEMLASENEQVKTIQTGDIIDVQALYVGILAPDEMMEIPGTILLKKGSLK